MDSERIRKSQIHMDRDLCIGAGMCESVAPDAFVVDDDGLVEFAEELAAVGDDLLDDNTNAAVASAAAVCPARAIILSAGDLPANA